MISQPGNELPNKGIDFEYEEIGGDNGSQDEFIKPKDFEDNLGMFYLKLQAEKFLPSSTVQYIAEELSNLKYLEKSHITDKLLADFKAAGLEDICDGEVFSRDYMHMEDFRSCIHLLIFQDAFETVNPLGSARCIHKIVGIYYTLLNIPPELRSTVDHMQLILLCRDSYFKDTNNCLRKLVSDLKDLETQGVLILGKRYKGFVTSLLGDNLGHHEIGDIRKFLEMDIFVGST